MHDKLLQRVAHDNLEYVDVVFKDRSKSSTRFKNLS